MTDHGLRARVARWLQLEAQNGREEVATCAITDLAFVRILSQAVYGYSVHDAKRMLEDLKGIEDLEFIFLEDDQPVAKLPSWVVRSQQVTDGHLAALARRHQATLATLDESIPGAFFVPA